jgi:hypothetical protein
LNWHIAATQTVTGILAFSRLEELFSGLGEIIVHLAAFVKYIILAFSVNTPNAANGLDSCVGFLTGNRRVGDARFSLAFQVFSF